MNRESDEGIDLAIELCSRTNHSNGIELYYVEKNNGSAVAFHISEGIVISPESSNQTVAHEIGHACGLCDIYRSNEVTQDVIEEILISDHCLLDWTGDKSESYYPENMELYDLIPHLLMFGYNTDQGSDISMGSVEGYWYFDRWIPSDQRYEQTWIDGLCPIGFDHHGNRSIISE